MKKLIVLCVTMALGITAMAQVEPKMEKPGVTKEQKIIDCYLMKDGKVWILKDNTSSLLNTEVTLVNGTRIKPDGTVITESGEITSLNEGDKVYAGGQVEKAPVKKQMGENKDYDTIYKK